MAEKTMPKTSFCRVSVTIQNDGKNEREACRTIPSSMAPARRASRSERRAKAWFSVLMENVRPVSLDIEPEHRGLTDEAEHPARRVKPMWLARYVIVTRYACHLC